MITGTNRNNYPCRALALGAGVGILLLGVSQGAVASSRGSQTASVSDWSKPTVLATGSDVGDTKPVQTKDGLFLAYQSSNDKKHTTNWYFLRHTKHGWSKRHTIAKRTISPYLDDIAVTADDSRVWAVIPHGNIKTEHLTFQEMHGTKVIRSFRLGSGHWPSVAVGNDGTAVVSSFTSESQSATIKAWVIPATAKSAPTAQELDPPVAPGTSISDSNPTSADTKQQGLAVLWGQDVTDNKTGNDTERTLWTTWDGTSWQPPQAYPKEGEIYTTGQDTFMAYSLNSHSTKEQMTRFTGNGWQTAINVPGANAELAVRSDGLVGSFNTREKVYARALNASNWTKGPTIPYYHVYCSGDYDNGGWDHATLRYFNVVAANEQATSCRVQTIGWTP